MDEVVPLVGSPTEGRVDLDAVRLAEPRHLGGQRLPRRDGVVVRGVDEEYRRRDAADGREEPRAQLRRAPPAVGCAGEIDDRPEGGVALGHEQGEGPSERVSGDRDAARVDLGERTQEREPGEGVTQLIGLQQMRLDLVAPLVPMCRKLLVQRVAAVGAPVGRESGPAPEEEDEDVTMSGENGSERRGLLLEGSLITLPGFGAFRVPAPVVEQDRGKRPPAPGGARAVRAA
jgi:hypothetical protein